MGSYLTWLSIVACVVLCGACIMLYLDGHGQRKTTNSLARRVAALEAMISTHGDKLGALSSGIATAGDRLDHLGRDVDALAGAVDRRLGPIDTSLGAVSRVTQRHEDEIAKLTRRVGQLDHEFAHVADLAFDASEAREHRLPPGAVQDPPIDMEGDRPGVNPPPVDDHDTPEEPTQLFTAQAYPAILGRSSLVPRAPIEGPTLISARAVPMTDPIEERYLALCDAARKAGLAVDHCNDRRTDCDYANDAVGACLCSCDGCTRAAGYAAQAEREIMGPPQADTPRSGRTE